MAPSSSSPATVNAPFIRKAAKPRGTILLIITINLAQVGLSDEAAKLFRADTNRNESLEWYQLKGNEYPPPGSAHYISGELIQIDPIERKFILRTDRTDDQRRSHFDLPLGATMLPYGSIYYHGSPASLEDIPFGTHLHGLFYRKGPDDKTLPVASWHDRVTPEADFSRCFKLEDDFSYYRNAGKIWKIDQVDLEKMNLTATPYRDEKPAGKPAVFELQNSTRVWRGRGIGDLRVIEAGQEIQFNITWATLYGPGRIREIWVDGESRELASKYQKEKHLTYQKQRGLAGRIDAVDNRERFVTIDIFGGVNEELLQGLKESGDAGIAVARESLVTYDPVNDRISGPIQEVEEVGIQPGGSGIRIKVKPALLLEGFRPGKIVRVYPSSWPVIALPMEERYFGRY